MNPEDYNKQQLCDILYRMALIRFMEEALDDLFARGRIFGTSHLCTGQEAVAVGACYSLENDDLVTSTHRGHGHALARGVDPGKFAAELLGKDQGLCRGRGGTQHLSDLGAGFLGTNGVTGGFIPIAAGAALALKLRNKPGVILSFFGDGASNTGYFHESLNFSSINKLPVIFICENNLYGMSMHVKDSTSVENIADRAIGYSMPGVIVDGMDVLEVNRTVNTAIDRARNGKGPTLVEAKTYRFSGHSKSDRRVYRTREEEISWRKKDPIEKLSNIMLELKIAPEELLKQTLDKAKTDVNKSVEWALSLPEPQADQITAGLYS
jgi:acetoin:2,6-dichlorophenolindophenol oxidoreductase subunit alpha